MSSPATRWLIRKLVANKVMMSMPWIYGLDGEFASYPLFIRWQLTNLVIKKIEIIVHRKTPLDAGFAYHLF